MGGPAKGPCPYGSPSSAAEGSIHEGCESHQGRAAKEGERGREEEKQQKLWVQERGKDTDSEDDDDEEDDDEVLDDIEWDDLQSEDVLMGIRLSL